MEIYLERENKTIEFNIETPISCKAVLNQLDISLESVILLKNDEICLEDELVSQKDSLKILSVVSGG